MTFCTVRDLAVTGDLLSRMISVSLVLLILPLANCFCYSGNQHPYDPHIECDLAELIWEYSKKLMPSRGVFTPVYDAVNLDKCNVTKHADGKPAENTIKRR